MLLSSDTAVGVTKSMGLGMIGLADAFVDLSPDVVLYWVIGSRPFQEVAAMVGRIPIAHIHGGEITEGLIDEAMRHSISKMSHLHFVATDEYRRRVIQLGENPQSVFNVGGLGLDNIKKLELLSREDLERDLGLRFRARNLLITFHPITLDDYANTDQIEEFWQCLRTWMM